jgi:probable addiction module antidote protein
LYIFRRDLEYKIDFSRAEWRWRDAFRFLVAIRNVAEAQGGVGNLAKKAGIGRESLYKTLSEKGNPKWHTLVSLVIALGLNLRLT